MSLPAKMPKHIAIVMDGNGRWARSKSLPRFIGHKKGVEAVREIVKTCSQLNIESLSLFAFSSENWKRPEEELEREAKALAKNNVRLKIIGDLSAFSAKLQDKIAQVEELTSESTGLNLIVAANYGGRWDITEATRKIAQQVELGEKSSDSICADDITKRLTTVELSDPDLFIRTGGEKRISNFLIWQMAYAELYFTDVLWPDFNAEHLNNAIHDYSSRQRRFGKTSEQVIADEENKND